MTISCCNCNICTMFCRLVRSTAGNWQISSTGTSGTGSRLCATRRAGTQYTVLRGTRGADARLIVAFSQLAGSNVRLSSADPRGNGGKDSQEAVARQARNRPDPLHAGRAGAGLVVPGRASAQATCSRTSGEGWSARLASAARISADSGALPSATAMLRNQRSWPMRRIGLPARRSLNSASRPREQFDQPRLHPARGAAKIQDRPTARSGSTDSTTGNRRSRRCDCRSAGGIPRGWRRPVRWSGRKCSAAHRRDRAR